MNNNNKHSNDRLGDEFFSRAEIPYKKSREEAWQAIEEKVKNSEPANRTLFTTERIIFSLAAAFAILISIGAFLRFYTVTIKVPAGEQRTEILPDGSRVDLNAQSVITYHPYWWNVTRLVGFEGEGFFDVEEGKAFRVRSVKGSTEVLGTSFNVYSRPDAYRVLCISGKVKVSDKSSESVILTPDYEAEIIGYGKISMKKRENSEQTISWKDGMFTFTATPLQLVFQEIERQYSVRILFEPTEHLEFTGYFSKDSGTENVLKMVCKPFNLKYTRKAENIYEVSY
jgi:ferric-dicitrate binding protein FerR (iron transport regulator)